MRRHVVSARGRVAIVGAALAVAFVSAVSVASASTKFDYTTSINYPTGDLVVVFDEGSLKRFDGVAYRLDAFGAMFSPTFGYGAVALVETETPLVPDTSGRVTGSLTTDLHLFEFGPCGCSGGGGRYVEYTDIVLMNLTTGHVYRLDPIRLDYGIVP